MITHVASNWRVTAAPWSDRHLGDVPTAAAAYKKMLVWRAEAGADEIRQVSHGLQLQPHMENTYCSCKLTPPLHQDIVARGLGLSWADYPRGAEIVKLMAMKLDMGVNSEGHIVQCENTGLTDIDGIFELGLETMVRALQCSMSTCVCVRVVCARCCVFTVLQGGGQRISADSPQPCRH